MDRQQFDQSSAMNFNNQGAKIEQQGIINNNNTHNYRNVLPIDPGLRKRLLDRVYNVWIKKFIEPFQKGAAFIPLRLYDEPALAENPWKDIYQETERERSAGLLPDGTSITTAYDESEGAFLILGAPGSGKTTLLLLLAHTLLERARHDSTRLMPVIFNLSTWASKRKPLAEWLVDELSNRYQISKSKGKDCVAKGQILPLLDGLDEVAEDCRGACINAINTFLQQQDELSLIVGSRMDEYKAQPIKIIVSRAVIAQPLSMQQIHDYLKSANGNFKALLELLRTEPGFQQLAQNPLMLSTLIQTYDGKEVWIKRTSSSEEQKRQIFHDYVEHMLTRGGREKRYSSGQTKHWLVWLAKQMRQREQTVFDIENLQIDWLERSWPVEISTSLAFAFLTFPIGFTVYGLEYTVRGTEAAIIDGFLAGLLGAIVAFFFVLLIETGFRVGDLFPSGQRKKPVRADADAEQSMELTGLAGLRVRLAAFFTPLFWERAGFALLSGLLMGLLVEFLIGPDYAMINGLFIAAFLAVLGNFECIIHPAEKLVWSWNSLRKHTISSLLIGLGIGVLGGLADAYPYFQHMSVFLATMFFWLSIGVAIGIIIMLMRGFTNKELNKHQGDIKPNQGIRNSLSNSLLYGLSSGTLLGVVVFFFYSYVMHNVFRVGYINDIPRNAAVVYSVGDTAAVIYLFWLINGGFATVQHLMLRIHLWRAGYVAWHYPRFLNYAAKCILLIKIGGGYMFHHELLLGYFASLEPAEEASQPTIKAALSPFLPLVSETPGTLQEDPVEQPTAPPILTPMVSEVPSVLPCGHERRDPNARFCSDCGLPVSA